MRRDAPPDAATGLSGKLVAAVLRTLTTGALDKNVKFRHSNLHIVSFDEPLRVAEVVGKVVIGGDGEVVVVGGRPDVVHGRVVAVVLLPHVDLARMVPVPLAVLRRHVLRVVIL